MAVVALLGVLAVIAVPTFFKEGNRGKAQAEVNAMFAELAMREESYKQDSNVYLAAARCPTALPPATTGTAASTCTTTGSPWATMRVQPPQSTLRCAYEIVTGAANAAVTPPAGFTFTAPAMGWYYIHAICDMDGNAAVNSQFFMSSADSRIQSKDVGT